MKSYQFRNKIMDDIRSGRLAPGAFIGLARELSERHGIPQITINRTLNELVRQGVVERIRNRGTFVSRRYSPQKRLRIGIAFALPFVQDTSLQFFSAAFQIFPLCARQVLNEAGYDLFEFTFKDLHRKDFDRGLKLDGLLLNTDVLDPNTVPNLLGKPYPIVSVQQGETTPYPFHQVIPDLPNGFHETAARLRESGINEVTLLFLLEEVQMARMKIFRLAAAYQGFTPASFRKIYTGLLPGDFGQLAGYKLGCTALKTHTQGMTYFSASDILSCGVLSAFFEQKLKPGTDFNLISFDNLEAEGLIPFGRPVLTSVDFPKRAIIRRAIRLIEEETTSPSGEIHVIKLPCALVERETFSSRNETESVIKSKMEA